MKKNTKCGSFDFGKGIIKKYDEAEVVVLSTKWNNEEEIKDLDEIISKIKKDQKIVIIMNNGLESKLYTSYKFNLLDYFVFKEKRLPNSKELLKIEKEMYTYLKNNKYTDIKLQEISDMNDIIFLKKEDYLCDKIKKKCDVLTPEGYRISWDYGHYTNEGSKYLGKKIHKINWFKVN